MTLITFKDGCLCADSGLLETNENAFIGSVQKVHRLSGGGLFASAGDADTRDLLTHLAEFGPNTTRDDLRELAVDHEGILVMPDGRTFYTEYDRDTDTAQVTETGADYLAVGVGTLAALMAMYLGENAHDAVEDAAGFMAHVRLPVQCAAVGDGPC